MEGVAEIEIKGKGVRARKLQVYKDFGDVRYTGDRYVAFYNWWRNRVNTNETRGEYLFAEPVIAGKVEVLENEKAAVEAVKDSERVVISIPLNRQRQHVDRVIDRILKKNLKMEKGRKVKDPSNSKARYKLTKSVQMESLRKAFLVYDEKNQAKDIKQSISNKEIAERSNIKLNFRNTDLEMNDDQNRNRVISATVSRYLRIAKQKIDRTNSGFF